MVFSLGSAFPHQNSAICFIIITRENKLLAGCLGWCLNLWDHRLISFLTTWMVKMVIVITNSSITILVIFQFSRQILFLKVFHTSSLSFKVKYNYTVFLCKRSIYCLLPAGGNCKFSCLREVFVTVFLFLSGQYQKSSFGHQQESFYLNFVILVSELTEQFCIRCPECWTFAVTSVFKWVCTQLKYCC